MSAGGQATKAMWFKRIIEMPWNQIKDSTARRRRVVFEQGGKCTGCGLSEWRGVTIAFELEHKDGDHSNNARENVEAHCPNCHSQTPTWRGRNGAARHKGITDEMLVLAIETHGKATKALRSLGLNVGGSNLRRVRGLVAQLAARSARIREVDGSTPFGSSSS